MNSIGNERDPQSVQITRLLEQSQSGDHDAEHELFAVLQQAMRETAGRLMRSEKPGATLQATAVVNEAVIKLLSTDVVGRANDRRYLFGAANRAMKQVLIDYARKRNADKRPSAHQRSALDVVLETLEQRDNVQFPALHAALVQLEQRNPRQAEVIELRFFSGLSLEQISELTGLGLATVKRDLTAGRAKLFQMMSEEDEA
ncbi:MAG: ECF-type sigma factor [Planctomycetaceae bacterium]